jgi:hypothetical protein
MIRQKSILIRLTEAEHQQLTKRAELAGMPTAELIRRRLFGSAPMIHLINSYEYTFNGGKTWQTTQDVSGMLLGVLEWDEMERVRERIDAGETYHYKTMIVRKLD